MPVFDQTTEINATPPTPEEIQLLQGELTLANQRISALSSVLALQSEMFGSMSGEMGSIGENAAFREAIESGQFDVAMQSLGSATSALTRMGADAARGGRIDSQTEGYIDELFAAQQGAGLSDIDAATQKTLKSLREELAPSLGLRPEDTPIMDRGGEIAGESIRQKSQLIRDIGAKKAESKLNFPLAQGELGTAQNQFLFNAGEAGAQFQSDLQQQAFLNRLLLQDRAGNLGLGIANATGSSPGTTSVNVGRNRVLASPSTISGLSLDDLGTLFSGGGGLLEGITSILGED